MPKDRVTLRLIRTPCCGVHLNYINARLPKFCPECGQMIRYRLRESEHVLMKDENALLKYRDPNA
jgi:hypothetical protein